VGVLDGVGVIVGVLVGTGVDVLVAVGVSVFVGVGDGLAVGVVVGVLDGIGVEVGSPLPERYSTCNKGAPRGSPSADSATLSPVPEMMITNELPLDQPDRPTISSMTSAMFGVC
jgi:hypothetical protein